MNKSVLLASLCVAFTSVCAAQTSTEPDESQQQVAAAIPPAPQTYMGREIAITMHYTGAPWLVRESREREEGTKLLLDQLDIEPGMTICDMGCGNGFYTIPMAEQTGKTGRVYAVDIQQEMLDLLQDVAEEAELSNIEVVLGTAIDPKLPDALIDLMILVDVYHEMSHPQQMLAAIRKCLKPDGRLVLVEFRAEDPEVPIKKLHKMSKVQVLKELTANGFKLKCEFNELPRQHMLTFQIDPDWERVNSAGRESPDRPNVIVLITDDQGYGDLAAHGNTIISTPNLDRLAAESVRLTDFHVDPTCSPSRSALMSGRYSTRITRALREVVETFTVERYIDNLGPRCE